MKIFCSTGNFIGRVNNRNYKLIPEAHKLIRCDGFEFMIFNNWDNNLIDISNYLASHNINIPIVHSVKDIGTDISMCTKESHETAINKIMLSCKSASILGSEYILIHPWGYPESDKNLNKIINFIPDLVSVCSNYDKKLLIEVTVVNQNDPIYDIKKVIEKNPYVNITIDTRHLAFHGILEKLYQEEDLFSNIKHVHLNDYRGGINDWNRLREKVQLGNGLIDFDNFFNFLESIDYEYGITLESSFHTEIGIDSKGINHSLDYIRKLTMRK